MAKKTLPIVCQVTPSSSQIAVDEMIYLFWMNAQYMYFFFQLPKLNKFCLGAELAPTHQVIKKAQNGSSVGLHAVFHFMPQRLQNLIKKKTNKQTNKKGMPVTEHLIHVFDSEINIF